MRVIDLALNDIRQLVRDWKSAFFLLIMPVGFTLLFGVAFGGFASPEEADPRLPVAYLDEDRSGLSGRLRDLLAGSAIVRLEPTEGLRGQIERLVAGGDRAAALIVPAGYGARLTAGEPAPLTVIVDPSSSGGQAAQTELQAAALRLASAAAAARASADGHELAGPFAGDQARQRYLEEGLALALAAWQNPPVTLATAGSGAAASEASLEDNPFGQNAFAHASPGMMAQFAIAGLMGAASILVLERKSRALQRLLTTNMTRPQILLGHYLAMFLMIFIQLLVLMFFGQLFLRLAYFGQPLASLLLATAGAAFAASLGLLIGALARSEEQVIVFSLVPMFLLAALGGAWVPLEFTPEAFQRIANLTPLAWLVDGFKDVIVRGQGLETAWQAVLVLMGYAAALFSLAVWRFRFE